MAFSNAEKQARWRERHLDNSDGTKTRLKFIFDTNTRARLTRVARHRGRSVTSLIRDWPASAERRIVAQLSTSEALLRWQMTIVIDECGYQP
jgi:hypothetical protein